MYICVCMQVHIIISICVHMCRNSLFRDINFNESSCSGYSVNLTATEPGLGVESSVATKYIASYLHMQIKSCSVALFNMVRVTRTHHTYTQYKIIDRYRLVPIVATAIRKFIGSRFLLHNIAT